MDEQQTLKELLEIMHENDLDALKVKVGDAIFELVRREPGAEAFVKEGDRVEAGQVLCILEAMKLFNEITSDYSGIVTRIVPENGELVSLGQELFWIEP